MRASVASLDKSQGNSPIGTNSSLPWLRNSTNRPWDSYHGSNVPTTWHMKQHSPNLRFKSSDLSNEITEIELSASKLHLEDYIKHSQTP